MSIGLAQYDETGLSGRRHIGEPRLEVIVHHKEQDADVDFELSLDEATQLAKVLDHAIGELMSTVNKAADPVWGPIYVLGWTPEVAQ